MSTRYARSLMVKVTAPLIYMRKAPILVNTEQMGDLAARKIREGELIDGDKKLNVYIYDTTLRDGHRVKGCPCRWRIN